MMSSKITAPATDAGELADPDSAHCPFCGSIEYRMEPYRYSRREMRIENEDGLDPEDRRAMVLASIREGQ